MTLSVLISVAFGAFAPLRISLQRRRELTEGERFAFLSLPITGNVIPEPFLLFNLSLNICFQVGNDKKEL